MHPETVNGDTIYVVSRHSNWSAAGIEKAFIKAGIYPQAEAWKKFLRLAIITLGVAFTVSSIIFFFAYNWQYLHRFVKLGILQGLIVVTVFAPLLLRQKPILQNILLTGASVLVGCLFAVFGQIYQTGANAYDFFLGWTVFIAVWCVAAGFAPLWTLFVGLLNTTILFYAEQVARDWPDGLVEAILFSVNVIAVLVAETLLRQKTVLNVWFIRVVTLVAVSCSTIAICSGIFKTKDGWLLVNVFLAIVFYSLAIWRSIQTKHVFYMTVIPLSVIIIISALIMQASDNEYTGGLFITSVFIAVSITVLIRKILQINKKWHGQQLIN